ncbi:hypothetical protein [Flavobacterium soli]|uniref:hypothetical protein n=1 Tax=Flavobacterium soli TaxID=344881 RepID=UPI00047B0A00|nr:hypothetical protein [Flavobacterium soli]
MTDLSVLTTSILALVSAGIGGYTSYFFASKSKKSDAKQVTKETRYKAIILMCYALVNYEKEKTMLVINRPDINSIERLKNEIHVEFINMSLYASDNVIISMKHFLIKQDTETLNTLAIAMRKDLYGIRTSLNSKHFSFDV